VKSKIPYTWVEVQKILVLQDDGKIWYNSIRINDDSERRVWMRIEREEVGITALFGYENSDKVISRRWYPNGWADIKRFLVNNQICKP